MATDAVRYWAKVAKGDGCWIWTGARNAAGYGVFVVDRRQRKAHRVAWELADGPIPEGANVCHSCDNPPCVRREHLFLGTQRENLDDMTRKGRRHTPLPRDQRGALNNSAKLTAEQVAHIRGMALAGHYHDDIAARFGVTRSNVVYIARNKTWVGIAPVPYPPAVRDRPVGRSAPRKRAARCDPLGSTGSRT